MEGEPVIEFDAGFRRFDDTLFPGHVKLSMATDQGRLQRAVYTVTDETWRRVAEVQKLDVRSWKARWRGRGASATSSTSRCNMYRACWNDDVKPQG
jgi:hypothetical protein